MISKLLHLARRLVAYIWSYEAGLSRLGASDWRHFIQIMARVLDDLFTGLLSLRAMGLVYTTLLSLVPLLAVSLAVLKGFGLHDQMEPALTSLFAPMGAYSVDISARIVGFVENSRIGVLGALGFAMLIFTVISLIQKIEAAFNHTWRIRNSRTLIQRISNYLSVMMVGPILVFSALAITASLGSNTIVVAINELPYMSNLVKFSSKLLPYLLVIMAFSFVYLLVPNTRVRPRSAFYGGLIAGFLWQSSGIIFTTFIARSTSYTAIYSGFAILLLLMIWIYLSWLILLIGASIAYYHQHPSRLKKQRANQSLAPRLRERLLLQTMLDIASAYDQQLSPQTSADDLAQRQRVPVDLLARLLRELVDSGLLRQSAENPPQYLLARSPARIALVDILRNATSNRSFEASTRQSASAQQLLSDADQAYTVSLGDLTLADLVSQTLEESNGENSLV